jgi:hypothetical protein
MRDIQNQSIPFWTRLSMKTKERVIFAGAFLGIWVVTLACISCFVVVVDKVLAARGL